MNTGSKVKVIACDVTDPKQVDDMVARSIAEFGSVDVLVNNVGWTVDRRFMEKPREEWRRSKPIFGGHQLHPRRTTVHDRAPIRRHRQHQLRRRTNGRISGSSVFRLLSRSDRAKQVDSQGNRALRVEAEHGVPRTGGARRGRVHQHREHVESDEGHFHRRCIGAGETGLPFRRLAKGSEIANAVVFLSSDAASFITGQTLSVSAGYTMM